MKKIIKMLPYLAVNTGIFFLLPIFMQDTGSGMLVMLVGIPAICFVTAIWYGVKNSFQWLYPLLVAFLFMPSIFIFLNYTAWPYTIVYGIIALVGCLIGKLFYNRVQ